MSVLHQNSCMLNTDLVDEQHTKDYTVSPPFLLDVSTLMALSILWSLLVMSKISPSETLCKNVFRSESCTSIGGEHVFLTRDHTSRQRQDMHPSPYGLQFHSCYFSSRMVIGYHYSACISFDVTDGRLFKRAS